MKSINEYWVKESSEQKIRRLVGEHKIYEAQQEYFRDINKQRENLIRL